MSLGENVASALLFLVLTTGPALAFHRQTGTLSQNSNSETQKQTVPSSESNAKAGNGAGIRVPNAATQDENALHAEEVRFERLFTQIVQSNDNWAPSRPSTGVSGQTIPTPPSSSRLSTLRQIKQSAF